MTGTDYVCQGCGKHFPAEKGTAAVYRHVDKCSS